MKSKKPAVFLDRDGVLNEDINYAHKPADAKLLPGVGESLRRLKDQGFLLIVVTNQSGVARGMFTLADVDRFHAAMQENLRHFGVKIDGFYVCPHHTEGKVAEYTIACDCRKPGTKNVLQAIKDFNVDVPASYFIGDRESDIACGLAANLATIQVMTQFSKLDSRALKHVKNLKEAVALIV